MPNQRSRAHKVVHRSDEKRGGQQKHPTAKVPPPISKFPVPKAPTKPKPPKK